MTDTNFLVKNGLLVNNAISVNSSMIVINTASFSANSTIGSNGQVLTSNGTSTYWAPPGKVVTQTLVDGATIAWDGSLGAIATVTIAASRTMLAPSNLSPGFYLLHVIQGGSGSYTMTWNAVFKWPGGVAPTLTTTVGARDIMSFTSDGTNLYGTYINAVH